jgi:hypothetical protein
MADDSGYLLHNQQAEAGTSPGQKDETITAIGVRSGGQCREAKTTMASTQPTNNP